MYGSPGYFLNHSLLQFVIIFRKQRLRNSKLLDWWGLHMNRFSFSGFTFVLSRFWRLCNILFVFILSLLRCMPCLLTCSRANVPSGYVLTCQRALRASMLPNATCVLTCSLVNVPCVLTWSHPNVLCVLKCSRANVPCGLTCSRTNELCVLTCLRTNVPCVLTYQRADVYYVLTCQRALRTYVPLGKT